MPTTNSTPITIEHVADYANQVISEVEKAVVGKRRVLTEIMAAFSRRAATFCWRTIRGWPKL